MKRSLQLRIPTPCTEDWAAMQPTEKGRHCQSCRKTVVDFTVMSDAEIIEHLSQAGPHVCGRLMPDQLNRALMPAPVQKNGRSGWAWVLAALMLAKGSDDKRAEKAAKVEMRAPGTGVPAHIGYSEPVVREESDTSVLSVIAEQGEVMGDIAIVPDTNIAVMGKPVGNSGRAFMGDTTVVGIDSIRRLEDPVSPVDSAALIAPAVETALAGRVGGIVAGAPIRQTTDNLLDTVKRFVADTMVTLGWRPASDLNIYPNPVSRGGTMQLAWTTQPGQYQVTLINMRGQLIAERMLNVGGAGQVDSWEMPASLAAGIYVLRVVRAGGAAVAGATGETGPAGVAGSAGPAGMAAATGPSLVCTRELMIR